MGGQRETKVEMDVENDAMNDESAASPTSVLKDEDEDNVDTADPVLGLVELETESPLLPRHLIEEEEKLIKARVKEENEKCSEQTPHLKDSQFNKLDELLTQTQLYSEFLLEKMDDISTNGIEPEPAEEEGRLEKNKGRGAKRKATFNNKKAKRAVAAMLTRSHEGAGSEDMNLTEEERVSKGQSELVPLLSGGNLKSYQLKGVKWLISLWQNGLNGILADQMGLGKTIQTIGFLAHLKGKGLDGPYLIIAPLSTLSNWVSEIQRFTPSINAIIYHGNKDERDEIRRKHMPKTVGPTFPLIVTSYEVAMNDARRCLRHYKWKYLVVDEAKKLEVQVTQELKYLPVENKLLLTGTPLQNNLSELWSLLNFILPDIFSSHAEFESWVGDLKFNLANNPVRIPK